LKADKARGQAKHGMWKKPEYDAWRNMKARCLNPRHRLYAWYGGRGIGVCKAWRRSFKKFFSDVGPRPSSVHSLGRIDNDRGYEPDNVRWMTISEQKRCTSYNRYFTINGRSMVLTDWAKEFGVPLATVTARVNRGWSIEEALGLRAKTVSG
jgi:hypothetical protein